MAFLLPDETRQALIEYLADRPYRECVALIAELSVLVPVEMIPTTAEPTATSSRKAKVPG